MAPSADGRFAWDGRSEVISKCCLDCGKGNAYCSQKKLSRQEGPIMAEHEVIGSQDHHFTNKIVKIFLDSKLSLILILLAVTLGFAALSLTPREEDPQIVVPLADIYVNFPGHSAGEVEQLIAAPLERILYQIDGVEFVYSMSREGQ